MAGIRIDITVDSDGVDLSADVGDALRNAASRRGTRLEIRRSANPCMKCLRNNDPARVLTGELHAGWTTPCKCRVVEVDSRGREADVIG